MYMKKLILILTALAGIAACSDRHYWKGADIGWATEYEADGQYFYNKDGERRECSELMKELGLDALRFRGWTRRSTATGTAAKTCW